MSALLAIGGLLVLGLAFLGLMAALNSRDREQTQRNDDDPDTLEGV